MLTRAPFGVTISGEPVDLFVLANPSGMEVQAITRGATITSIKVADRAGSIGEVILGFDSLDQYERSTAYHGAVIGRYANRIAHGRFTLDDTEYQLGVNDPPNHLHRGWRGFDKVVWSASPFERSKERGVTFRYVSPDGEEGFPGTLTCSVTYRLTDENALHIDYKATTNRPTPVNLTQHTYFNLAGHGDVREHELTIVGDVFLPVDETLIPTGVLEAVAGTPFDFRVPCTVGSRITWPHRQLLIGRGYDHTWVLRRSGPSELTLAARLHDPGSGRVLEVLTTEPGVQCYTGNCLDGREGRRPESPFLRYGGLCLETQHFPDSLSRPAFPGTVLRPAGRYRSATVWRFTTAPCHVCGFSECG